MRLHRIGEDAGDGAAAAADDDDIGRAMFIRTLPISEGNIGLKLLQQTKNAMRKMKQQHHQYCSGMQCPTGTELTRDRAVSQWCGEDGGPPAVDVSSAPCATATVADFQSRSNHTTTTATTRDDRRTIQFSYRNTKRRDCGGKDKNKKNSYEWIKPNELTIVRRPIAMSSHDLGDGKQRRRSKPVKVFGTKSEELRTSTTNPGASSSTTLTVDLRVVGHRQLWNSTTSYSAGVATRNRLMDEKSASNPGVSEGNSVKRPRTVGSAFTVGASNVTKQGDRQQADTRSTAVQSVSLPPSHVRFFTLVVVITQ